MSLKPLCGRSFSALNNSLNLGTRANQLAIGAGKRRCLFANSNRNDLDTLFNANQKSMTTATGRLSNSNPFLFIHKYSSRNRYLIKKLDLFEISSFDKKSRSFSSNSSPLRAAPTPDETKPPAENQTSSNFQNGNKIDSALLARQFISTLTLGERTILKEELIVAEKESAALNETAGSPPPPITWKQLFMGK